MMQSEYATHLGNRLWISMRTMLRRDDQLRLRAFDVRAPIWHHAVAAVRRITTAPVAFNRMKWNAGRDWEFIDLKDESIVRRQRVDAIRHAIELHSGWI